jgi:hypothetical protein
VSVFYATAVTSAVFDRASRPRPVEWGTSFLGPVQSLCTSDVGSPRAGSRRRLRCAPRATNALGTAPCSFSTVCTERPRKVTARTACLSGAIGYQQVSTAPEELRTEPEPWCCFTGGLSRLFMTPAWHRHGGPFSGSLSANSHARASSGLFIHGERSPRLLAVGCGDCNV